MTTSPRLVRKQTVTSVSLDSAWNTWTTPEGVTSFFAPKANIQAQVGGPYELFFDLKSPRGFQGTEGCKVLIVDTPRKLTFEYLAPAQFPNVRRIRTRVDAIFEEVLKGGLVKVSLVHSGFLEGEEWDESVDYFNYFWDLVLGRFQYRFTRGPVDWSHPYYPPGLGSPPQPKLRDKAEQN